MFFRSHQSLRPHRGSTPCPRLAPGRSCSKIRHRYDLIPRHPRRRYRLHPRQPPHLLHLPHRPLTPRRSRPLAPGPREEQHWQKISLIWHCSKGLNRMACASWILLLRRSPLLISRCLSLTFVWLGRLNNFKQREVISIKFLDSFKRLSHKSQRTHQQIPAVTLAPCRPNRDLRDS